MKASTAAQQRSDDETEPKDTRPTSAETAARPGVVGSQSSSRPHLLRSPLGHHTDLAQAALDGAAEVGSKQAEEMHGSKPARKVSDPTSDQPGKPEITRIVSGTEEERLAKLKEAVGAKLMMQQRKRGSYGAKRVSPIREEDTSAMSPSLNAAFASPVEPLTRPLSTVSTESTESARTVRASVPPTPAESKPLRTPSYPFPYVPGTPRTWSSSFHQPFTTLSPTVTARYGDDQDTPGKSSPGMTSSNSTPGVSAQDFLPHGQGLVGQEDPRFPTPNLYEMVLQLNTEPGLEQWWATVTNLMHDHYKADRVTLVVPLDPTDIENVPWGQKATFSMNGREEFVPHKTVEEQTSHVQRPELVLRGPSQETPKEFHMQKLHPERLRPRLEARHSYAGPPPGREPTGAVPSEGMSKPGARPQGPLRTMTHAPGMASGVETLRQAPQRFASSSSVGGWRHTSLSDPEFSSIAGGIDAGPYAEVFATVRSLDHEIHPLIESGGVNRVLDRGKVVTVTRDYSSEGFGGSSNGHSASETHTAEATPREAPGATAAHPFGDYRHVFGSENAFTARREYEEYEQNPSSPWAQSPAPSPAMQADEEANPFFSTEEQQVEESFNPASGTPRDYSKVGQVEAIGVDRASTVIHIPLVHPSLSQPMQSLRMRQSAGRPGIPRRSNTLDMARMAPIAILSILTSTVPYPPNLTQSLKLLGSHLATSLATAQQFSSFHPQAISIRHRRTASGHNAGNAPMTIEPTSLDDIVNAELEDAPGSISGSMTSPSDYSGRSKHSPASSLAGTPGWDPAAYGWTSSRSVAGTPAYTGTELFESYFDTKKKTAQRSGSSVVTPTHATPAKSAGKGLSQEHRQSARKPSPTGKDDVKHVSDGHRMHTSRSMKEELSPPRSARERSPGRLPDTPSLQRPVIRQTASHFVDESTADAARRHSLLHSYGADFETSFGTTPGGVMNSGVGGHTRKPSYSEDMPPPSERLLRTIIDSVPVQIFTAKPDT
ncbi:hypothetical protein B0A55_13714, partial [Friedmanniomyces simplex]